MMSFGVRKQAGRLLSIVLALVALACTVIPNLTAGQGVVYAGKTPAAGSAIVHPIAGPAGQKSGDLTPASDSGTWTATGSMLVARRDHTATLLTDGRVLIAGWTMLAELYDPATGTFSSAGNMLCGHGQLATATRLLDGRVLIAGGHSAQTCAELYDPLTGSFSLTGSMNVPHFAHSATLLRDGRVLIAGGGNFLSTGVVTTAIAELYDPATGIFTLTGSLNKDRDIAASGLLPDGRVLIAGGDYSTSPGFASTTDSAELYDPVSGAFSKGDNMKQARSGFYWTGTPVLNDGHVLMVATFPDDVSKTAEVYDPVTGTFSFTGSMVARHNIPSATRLRNGQVLVAGGYFEPGPVQTNAAELYDPLIGTFAATGNLGIARQQHAATLLPNGQVLVTGGFSGGTSGTELSSAELFTPANLPPIAKCRDITVRTDASCMATITTADVDNGSFDPDGDTITLTLDSTGPFGAGQHSVKLTATDSNGASASCLAMATVVCPPVIISASIDHKNLIVSGEHFDSQALIILNGQDQRTLHDDQDPNTLVGKKVAKSIASGQTVRLQVRNSDGILSAGFDFKRP